MAAGPSLANLEATRQDLHAARVQRVLRFAQLTAMSSDLDTWVAFDTSTDTVTAYVEDANNLGKANRLALSDPLTREDLILDLDGGVRVAVLDLPRNLWLEPPVPSPDAAERLRALWREAVV